MIQQVPLENKQKKKQPNIGSSSYPNIDEHVPHADLLIIGLLKGDPPIQKIASIMILNQILGSKYHEPPEILQARDEASPISSFIAMVASKSRQ